ncbi:MAG: bifunctional DNA primase/polymerase [Proteobacteria bacterium]|nr:bifunctional DNA primase/polymerase [Pseudomonadota bacterium]
MLNAAIEYLEMGFSLIPVKRSDKRPYIKWAEYQERHPTPDELEQWWTKWPDANIAVICGKISGIFVIDADGPKGIEWMNANLPKTGVYSKTGKGIHAVFKIPEGVTIKNAVRLAPEVDIRGEGGYFIVPPSIHESGHQYKWQFIMDGWDDLAEYSPNGNGKGRLNLDLSKVSPKLDVESIALGIEEGNRDVLLYKEACRLRGKNLTYDETWVVLKAFADRCKPPFSEKEVLVKLKQAWKHPPNDAEMITLSSDSTPEEDNNQAFVIPDKLLHPGGLLEEIVDAIEQNSAAAVPFFSLGAAIALVGNLAGMKVATQTGLRTNFYIVVIGYSGTGKNAPFEPVNNILLKSDANQTKGITEFTSAASIYKSLSKPGREISLMMLDELGLILKGLKNPNSSAGEIPRVLIKLFSSTTPESKTYANGDDLVVSWQHLSLFGASTPERFWESLSPGEITDGFIARMLLFESRHDALLPTLTTTLAGYDHVIEKANKIFNIPVEFESASKTDLIRKPKPRIVPMDDEAIAVFDPWRIYYHNKRNDFKGDPHGLYSIYGRVAEHAMKLSLVHAVSKDLDKVEAIKKESVDWACQLMDHLSEHMVRQIKENIADNDIQRWKQKILRWMKATNIRRTYKGATLRDIQRGPCQGLLKKDVERILESLLLAEQIGAKEEKSKMKTVIIYYVAQNDR